MRCKIRTPEQLSEPEIDSDSVDGELRSEKRIGKLAANQLIKDELGCSPVQNRFKKIDTKRV